MVNKCEIDDIIKYDGKDITKGLLHDILESGVVDSTANYYDSTAKTTKHILQLANNNWIEVYTDDKEDVVNHPSHYTNGNIECIDAITEAIRSLNGTASYLAGNIIKYIWRYKFKNGVEDLKKARWYLDRLIKEEE